MPHNNNAFQPKNARTIHTFDEEDNDDLDATSLFGSSMSTSTKKATSGTQALADFFNTTSPEEFQRPSPSSTVSTNSSSSSNFFRLRKNKRTPQQSKSLSSTTTLSSTLSITPSSTPTTTLSTLDDISIVQQKQQRNNKHIKITPSRSYSYKQQQSIKTSQSHHQQQQEQQRPLPLTPKSPTLSLSSSHRSSLAVRNNEPQSPILPNRRRESSLYSGSIRNNASLRGRMSDYGSSGRNHNNNSNSNNSQQRRNIMELFEQPPPLPVPPISSSPSNNNTNNIKPAKEIDRIDIALLQRLEQSINKDLSLSLPSNQSTVSKTTTKARRHCQTQTTETYITDTSSVLIDYQKNDSNNSSSYNHHSQQQQQLPGITVEQLEKQIADEKRRQKRLQAVMKESTDKFEVLSGLAYMKLRELWEEKMRWEEAYFTLNERLDEVQQQQQQQGTHNSSQEVSIPIVPGASLHPPPAQSI